MFKHGERKRYTFLEKIKGLIILRDHDFNSRNAAKEADVSAYSLVRWNQDIGLIVFDLLEKADGIPENVDEETFNRIMLQNAETEEEEVVSEAQFQNLVAQAKTIAVKRLKKKLKTERSTRAIADSLKILNDMGEGIEPVGSKKLKTASDYAQWLVDSYKGKSVN